MRSTITTTDLEDLPPGRITYVSSDQQVKIVLDSDHFEFWMEASPDAKPAVIDEFLDRFLHPLGLELISEDEDEPEVDERGWLRIYASPVVPVDDSDSGESNVSVVLASLGAFALSFLPVTSIMVGSPLEVLLNR